MTKVKPMIFNTEMVRALLDGRKVQTRRPVKLQPFYSTSFIPSWVFPRNKSDVKAGDSGLLYPNAKSNVIALSGYSVGDLIYVRETFAFEHENGEPIIPERFLYSATDSLGGSRVPSIHMPRRASRLTLKVTDVRVEQVQDISKADAEAEGFKLPPVDGQEFSIGAKTNFRHAWEKIYGDNWKRNDWVWVIDFEVIRQNVDEYMRSMEISV